MTSSQKVGVMFQMAKLQNELHSQDSGFWQGCPHILCDESQLGSKFCSGNHLLLRVVENFQFSV